jgi:hypothetical protein
MEQTRNWRKLTDDQLIAAVKEGNCLITGDSGSGKDWVRETILEKGKLDVNLVDLDDYSSAAGSKWLVDIDRLLQACEGPTDVCIIGRADNLIEAVNAIRKMYADSDPFTMIWILPDPWVFRIANLVKSVHSKEPNSPEWEKNWAKHWAIRAIWDDSIVDKEQTKMRDYIANKIAADETLYYKPAVDVERLQSLVDFVGEALTPILKGRPWLVPTLKALKIVIPIASAIFGKKKRDAGNLAPVPKKSGGTRGNRKSGKDSGKGAKLPPAGKAGSKSSSSRKRVSNSGQSDLGSEDGSSEGSKGRE